MIRVVCEECGKSYNYEVDDFCPKCGAYNQPSRENRSGAVVRSDGINEKYHDGSFVHEEVHQEKKIRRKFNLDQKPRSRPAVSRPSASAPRPSSVFSSGTRNRSGQSKAGSASAAVTAIVWIFFILIFFRACAL